MKKLELSPLNLHKSALDILYPIGKIFFPVGKKTVTSKLTRNVEKRHLSKFSIYL